MYSNLINGYQCLVEVRHAEEPYYQWYWIYAQRMGTAIEVLKEKLVLRGVQQPYIVYCDPVAPESIRDNHELENDGEIVWSPKQFAFPPTRGFFDLPTGVVASRQTGEYDIYEVKPGFQINTDEAGLISININVGKDQLLDYYQAVLKQFSGFRVFWAVIHGHWQEDPGDENEDDTFHINDHLTSADAIINYIKINRMNTLDHGFVTLTTYLDEGATNISITEHKQISVLTYSREVANTVIILLSEHGFNEQGSLISIARGIYHWHYRLPGSQAKSGLINLLGEYGFKPWQPGTKINDE